jgi:uncharacterized ferredoxin-like protein
MGEHLDYDNLRADTVRQVAKLMAAAAIAAPKSGGQLFLAGKHLFIETVIVDDRDTLAKLAAWMRARGKERREAIWFRDAEAAEAIDAVLFVGLADWYPPVYDCGACGYATCAEFMHATKQLRDESDELEFVGPQCNLRDIDLGIAVGSAAKTAAIHSIDARCQTRIAVGRTQARPDQSRHRRRALPLTHPQSSRLRSAHARRRLRRARPAGYRNPPARRSRCRPRGRREESSAATPPLPIQRTDETT